MKDPPPPTPDPATAARRRRRRRGRLPRCSSTDRTSIRSARPTRTSSRSIRVGARRSRRRHHHHHDEHDRARPPRHDGTVVAPARRAATTPTRHRRSASRPPQSPCPDRPTSCTGTPPAHWTHGAPGRASRSTGRRPAARSRSGRRRSCRPRPNRFVMWFAEKATAVDQMCLWSATATSPDGPFTYSTGPYCNPDQGGVIDPDARSSRQRQHLSDVQDRRDRRALHPDPHLLGRSSRTHAEEITAGTEHQLLEVMPAPSFEYPIVEAPTFIRSPAGRSSSSIPRTTGSRADYKVAVATCDGRSDRATASTRRRCSGRAARCSAPAARPRSRTRPATWLLAFHAWAAADLRPHPVDGSTAFAADPADHLPRRQPQGGLTAGVGFGESGLASRCRSTCRTRTGAGGGAPRRSRWPACSRSTSR